MIIIFGLAIKGRWDGTEWSDFEMNGRTTKSLCGSCEDGVHKYDKGSGPYEKEIYNVPSLKVN